MAALDMEDILRDESEIRKEGGLAVKAKVAFHSDIATFPALNTGATTFELAAVATGTLVMNALKYFHDLESDLEWSGLDSNSQGEMNYLSSNSTYTFEVAGWPKKLIGFLNTSSNRNLCMVLTDIAGKSRILGDAGLPAKITSFAVLGGKKTADKKSVMFTVYYPGLVPLFYEGVVPVEP
jgi:hypothetical protein